MAPSFGSIQLEENSGQPSNAQLKLLSDTFPYNVLLNPADPGTWAYTRTIGLIDEVPMFELTLLRPGQGRGAPDGPLARTPLPFQPCKTALQRCNVPEGPSGCLFGGREGQEGNVRTRGRPMALLRAPAHALQPWRRG